MLQVEPYIELITSHPKSNEEKNREWRDALAQQILERDTMRREEKIRDARDDQLRLALFRDVPKLSANATWKHAHPVGWNPEIPNGPETKVHHRNNEEMTGAEVYRSKIPISSRLTEHLVMLETQKEEPAKRQTQSAPKPVKPLIPGIKKQANKTVKPPSPVIKKGVKSGSPKVLHIRKTLTKTPPILPNKLQNKSKTPIQINNVTKTKSTNSIVQNESSAFATQQVDQSQPINSSLNLIKKALSSKPVRKLQFANEEPCQEVHERTAFHDEFKHNIQPSKSTRAPKSTMPRLDDDLVTRY